MTLEETNTSFVFFKLELCAHILNICDVSNTLSISVLSSIACYDCYPLNNRVFPLVQTRSEMALYSDLEFFFLFPTPPKKTPAMDLHFIPQLVLKLKNQSLANLLTSISNKMINARS